MFKLFRGEIPKNEDVICGGRIDRTDYSAPKHIESDEIIYFSTTFFRYADFSYNKERTYDFKMQKLENGKYKISEGYKEKLSCETDEDFAKRLQQVIKDQGLIKINGINKVTAGLPSQYGPCFLEAKYASEERLFFQINGEPDAEWTLEILDIFAKEFGKRGITDLLPKEEDKEITRFELKYSFGDISYLYGEILIPSTDSEKMRTLEDIATNGYNEEEYNKRAFAKSWDRVKDELVKEDKEVRLTKEHYIKLQNIVEETKLRKLHNGKTTSSGFDYYKVPMFYKFYIEYKNGKRMIGFSEDIEECKRFIPIAESFARYYEDFINNGKKENN